MKSMGKTRRSILRNNLAASASDKVLSRGMVVEVECSETISF